MVNIERMSNSNSTIPSTAPVSIKSSTASLRSSATEPVIPFHSDAHTVRSAESGRHLKVDNTIRSRGWSLWGGSNSATYNKDKPIVTVTKNSDKVSIENTHDKGVTLREQTYDESKVDGVANLEAPSSSSSEGRKRTWSFWHRQVDKNVVEVTGPVTLPQDVNPLANTYLAFDPAAIKKKRNSSDFEGKPSNEGNEVSNLVVPSFDILPKNTLWNRVGNLLGKNSRPQKYLYRTDPTNKLLEMSDGGKRPIKVLIVGVHGFFPTKVLRTFIGEPTGTSTKFVNEAEVIVEEYFEKRKTPIEISKIALEKEGEIFDRVDFFYDVMKSMAKDINQADFIYFVAHSQGCPVTIMLLSKLIETGVLNLDNTKIFNGIDTGFCPNKKVIAVLGMAGINNGPFYGADSTLLVRAYITIAKDAMMELFEFQKFDSILSKKFIQSLRVIISNNVKLTFVASVNDQLVPLYSAHCLFADHPNIFRSTFVDRGSRTPAFISRIVKIAGTLLNLGYDDHGIIKEISGSLAGPLTGGGHSNIYSERDVYELGITFSLETTDTTEEIPVAYIPYRLEDLGTNPYHLPWCMRGLLTETRRRMPPEEVNALYREYEDWHPDTKQLKDIKYRLNGLKYQL